MTIWKSLFKITYNRCFMGAAIFLIATSSGWSKSKKRNYETYLANSAAHIGTDLLAKDRSDAIGLNLISAALKLNPDNERALLTSMLIRKELNLAPVKHKYTTEDFIKRASWRGKLLYDKKTDEYVGAKTLAMLYFSLAELLKKDDETILIYLEKLHREDEVPGLVDILASEETVADWLDKKMGSESGKNAEQPVTFWGVGQPMAELTKLYGKAVRTKYAPQSNGTLKYFRTANGQVQAFISGGKCVRVEFQLSMRVFPSAGDRDAFVLKNRPGWKVVLEKPLVRGYENADRTMAASITEAGTTLTFVAWSKRFYK